MQAFSFSSISFTTFKYSYRSNAFVVQMFTLMEQGQHYTEPVKNVVQYIFWKSDKEKFALSSESRPLVANVYNIP